MPELPEVETIRRGLQDCILRQKIVDVEVLCEKSFIGPRELVVGKKIIKLRRKGKALLIDLENEITMMIHLRMTGQLIYRADELQTLSSRAPSNPPVVTGACPLVRSRCREDPETERSGVRPRGRTSSSFAGGHPTDSFFNELPDKQTRVVFTLEKGKLFFNDQRKFGFVKVLPTEEVELDKFIASLGKEPWELSAEELHATFQRRKGSPVKAVILDQKVVAGIGNIYADEALFFAKVHPARACGTISLEEAGQILEGARRTMDASIASGGSTMATYIKPDGTRGDYLENFAQVFRREGKECPRCGAEIEKIRVAGRGTHICPNCQKLEVGAR